MVIQATYEEPAEMPAPTYEKPATKYDAPHLAMDTPRGFGKRSAEAEPKDEVEDGAHAHELASQYQKRVEEAEPKAEFSAFLGKIFLGKNVTDRLFP